MKNKMVDLKNHLFQALERLNDESLSEEQIKTEIARAQAVSEIGKVIVDGAKTSLMYAKVTGKVNELDEEDYSQEQIQRPQAVYTNLIGHQKALEKYAS